MANPSIAAVLLLVLALAGLAVSLYFTGVVYGWMRPDARWIPRVCRMDEEACASVVDTAYGRLLGTPNAVYGIAWYMGVAGLALQQLATGVQPPCGLLILAAAGVVMFSIYLAWALVQKLDVHCPLCFASHGVNVAILVAIVAGCSTG